MSSRIGLRALADSRCAWSRVGGARPLVASRYGPYAGVGAANSVRFASLEAGENKTGHIKAGPNEGVLFFTNVFPLNLLWLLRIPWQSEKGLSEMLQKSKTSMVSADPSRLIQESQADDSAALTVTQILPRIKEGGAFVKFSHPNTITPTEVEQSLRGYIKQNKLRPWWSPFTSVRARLVRGTPWLEDLHRLPSSIVKVEFIPGESGEPAAELSQEQLYSLFRPYGKLRDITPQPQDSKIVPRYALLDFFLIRRAILAKNCLHGIRLSKAEGGGKGGTVLRLSYECKPRVRWIWDWLVNHPRIVIPLLAALIATLTVAIFDPIRTFFVKAHVCRVFSFSDNAIVGWFMRKTNDMLVFRRRDEDRVAMEAIWDDRKDNIAAIQKWLLETDNTFIVVHGPRGSEKRELVIDQALKQWKNKLIVDCKPIQDARGDGHTIQAVAQQTGYRPVFSWMNSITGMIDLAAQGAAGVKTGFSETLDAQLQKILNTTGAALQSIALEGRARDPKDSNLGDDEYLEGHPEQKPVVVIDHFLYKSQEDKMIYDKIAEWAARITSSNVAHVIFLTDDVSYTKTLGQALPDRMFHEISLSDCSPEVAIRYVLSYLESKSAETSTDRSRNSKEKSEPKSQFKSSQLDHTDLERSITTLGGRLTDLDFLARRIEAGETPSEAVNEIVEQSASEILKLFLSPSSDSRKYTPEQAWNLIQALSSKESLRYNEILLHDLFKSGGDAALAALAQAELISISETAGTSRPSAIRPGRPVYRPAFQRLVQDRVLKARLDLAICTELIKTENKSIEKAENELQVLGELPRSTYDVVPRAKWLLKKIKDSQAKVEQYEKESKKAKKILGEEY